MGKAMKAQKQKAVEAAPPINGADDGDDSMSDAPDFAELDDLADSDLDAEDDSAASGDEPSALEEEEDSDLEAASNDDDDDEDSSLPDASADSATTASAPLFPSTTPSSHPAPSKAIPYSHDAGHLLILDPNPLPPSATDAVLAATARDAAQSLLDHLLTTCPILTRPSTSTSTSGVEMQLPAPLTQLPREKPVPKAKETTKWEAFARKKGIGKYAKPGQGRAGDAPRAGKMVYDEAKGEWVPKWGYKGKNKEGEGDWLVEVDDKKKKKEGSGNGGEGVRRVGANVVLGVDDPRGMKRAERKEAVRRNERAQRANERKSRKGKGGL